MNFKYKAITKTGEQQSGNIEAATHENAVELLQRYEMMPVSVEETSELLSLSSLLHRVHRKVGVKKIVTFSKELSILISSGVSLVEALKIEYEQEENQMFREQSMAFFTLAPSM
jgi:type IV pilus assembly protein PilC